ncbi:MAG TPA: CorA family divalent cation transporter [Nitrospirales bacterium]|nr:hypothetical protein [Nitrospiraceae bacterium]HNP30332.1 CorA family divalent cation transporter [Nitrospirales bacterium]
MGSHRSTPAGSNPVAKLELSHENSRSGGFFNSLCRRPFDAARERMGGMQEELTGKLSEQMNKTMYILSVLAEFFLPITFVTGSGN